MDGIKNAKYGSRKDMALVKKAIDYNVWLWGEK